MIVVSQMDPVLHKYLIVGVVTVGHAFSEGINFFEIALILYNLILFNF